MFLLAFGVTGWCFDVLFSTFGNDNLPICGRYVWKDFTPLLRMALFGWLYSESYDFMMFF